MGNLIKGLKQRKVFRVGLVPGLKFFLEVNNRG